MKFTLNWLKKFLDTDKTIDEICIALTELGLEVEEVIDRSKELENFIVAEIISIKPHPDAQKLNICEVFDGNNNLQIVCGASNARSGIKVVLAPVGSIIPNGKFAIKASEIRGVKSNGMLCSEEELLVGSNSSGIIEMNTSANVGDCFIPYYGLDDPIIEIAVTPNRGDCLSVYGIARDLAAKDIGILKNLVNEDIKPLFTSSYQALITSDDCNLLTLREIRGVKNCESPEWLKHLLGKIGSEPISALVDITNYINLSFGQPLHVYDADKIFTKSIYAGYLPVKNDFSALNDKNYSIDINNLTINDGDKVLSLAGVIGGKDTKCEDYTQNILLEAAVFSPDAVTKSGREHNIITESRSRFERGIAPNKTIYYSNLAVNMILAICGGEVSELILAGSETIKQKNIEFNISDFKKLIGFELSKEEFKIILIKLGFVILSEDNGFFNVQVPSWRNDIAIKEDIIEEIIRIYGYNNIEMQPLPNNNVKDFVIKPIFSAIQRKKTLLSRFAASLGYNEVINWSFISSQKAQLFAEINNSLMLINPITQENDYLRPSIIPSLLNIVENNCKRSSYNASIFEAGPIFNGTKTGDEIYSVSGLKSGYIQEKSPGLEPRMYNFYDVKGDVELMIRAAGFDSSKCQIEQTAPKYYHPNRSASLRVGKTIIAYFGQIHPSIANAYDLKFEAYIFELFPDNIPLPRAKLSKKSKLILSPFQAVSRDFAFIADVNLNIGEVLSFVKSIEPKIIRAVSLFDVYQGEHISEGKKSFAFNVTMQSDEKTLTDEEIEDFSNNIISFAEQKFTIKLRA